MVGRGKDIRGGDARAGEIILSGALGPVSPVVHGDHLEVAISGIGNASATFLKEG
jgi:2-keto-4-pentenoate hydratase